MRCNKESVDSLHDDFMCKTCRSAHKIAFIFIIARPISDEPQSLSQSYHEPEISGMYDP